MITTLLKNAYLIIIVLLCFLSNRSSGQEGFTVKKQSVLTEIPALASVKNVEYAYKDSRGYIWLGANGGIYKYNGYETVHYPIDVSRPNDLTESRVTNIVEDKEGNIWFSVFGIGLKKFDPKTEVFTVYDINLKGQGQNLTLDNEPYAIVPHNGILRVNTSKGNCIFNPKAQKFVHDLDYDALLAGENNDLWAFLSDKNNIYHISLFDSKTNTFIVKHAISNVLSIKPFLILKNKIYLSVNNALGVYDISKNSLTPLDNEDKSLPLSIKPINDQKLLILRLDRLEIFDPVTSVFTTILNKSDFKSDIKGNSMLIPIDKQQFLLTGIKNYILNLSPSSIEVFEFKKDGIGFDFHNNRLYEWYQGRLGIGKNLIANLDKGTVVTPSAIFPALQRFTNANNEIANINKYVDANGVHWIALFGEKADYTFTTLYYFIPKTGNLESIGSFDFTGIDGRAETCLVKEGNNIWIGSPTGLVHFDIRTREHAFIKAQKDSAEIRVNNLFLDSGGDLWIGTQSGLRFKKRGSDIMVQFNIQPPSHINTHADWISKVNEDKNGMIWIGTGGGICVLNKKTGKYKWFTMQEGLADNFILNLEIDNGQNIWVSHDKGISNLNAKTGIIKNYTTTDGLKPGLIEQSTQLNDGAGTLVFASEGYIYRINPNKIVPDSTPVPIYITDVKLFNKSLEVNTEKSPLKQHISFVKDLTFKHNQNVITLLYSAVDFKDSEHRLYAYMLEGFDKDWQYVNQKREVTFTNLPPGTYTFRVKSGNRDNVWSEMATPLKITVSPPWWRTWLAYLTYLAVIVGGIRGYSQYKSRTLKEQNKILEEKVKERTAELNQTINNLKATQDQLIQKEKMASLGELTAGIAHEIQNPLNFVNNFSELSVELAHELKDEIKKSDLDKGLVEDLTSDLTSNQEKINHHGKRASNIVKSMLEHSRPSTGIKEPTDINALIREYLPLSYHGMRAKDKVFNADFKMELAENMPKINVIPQDIGRVLLNLFNNAFYAVNQRALSPQPPKGGLYVPTVIVSTHLITPPLGGQGGTMIKVKDNGNGIPDPIKQKIFQPFFTTKPTGEGTGLGLSLSYDIITKGHGGNLEVISTEGVGSEFVITLTI